MLMTLPRCVTWQQVPLDKRCSFHEAQRLEALVALCDLLSNDPSTTEHRKEQSGPQVSFKEHADTQKLFHSTVTPASELGSKQKPPSTGSKRTRFFQIS